MTDFIPARHTLTSAKTKTVELRVHVDLQNLSVGLRKGESFKVANLELVENENGPKIE